ncbi:MAG: hypothetical protein CMJ58_12505 [Planctomycetaceae bacterium]|nr:hypothetical protein [Planctomycetaceae bacterium]
MGLSWCYSTLAIALLPIAASAGERIADTSTATSECSPAADDTREIPLKRVWALDMPGTQSVRRIDWVRPQDSMVDPIRAKLRKSKLSQLPPGFVVRGTGREALKNVYRVLVRGEDPLASHSDANELSIVFLARLSSRYVHLKEVKVSTSDHKVCLTYTLVTHETQELTEHFAIIPVGVLPEGRYEVSFSLATPKELSGIEAKKYREYASRVVPKGFSFAIAD